MPKEFSCRHPGSSLTGRLESYIAKSAIISLMTKPDRKSSLPLSKSVSAKPLKTKTIEINKKLCKQCEICVYFCPQKVFALDDDSSPKVVDLEACTGCRLCELKCPDFAIDVELEDEVSLG